ncbi:uncharacterized protein LOC133348678 isoform X4 [Lethenteron reissneri]|uniref:uncharacterized protein LOC133348678 isoform X4 n=1 Tax=Lethenteron reissneri TaxID=7753 RepID=UPI002AB62B35|nr:uncharacterized protein LOC133348678 isoform X4 [Lethenteron reissneri]
MESRDHGLDHLMSITMATVAMMIMVVMATAGVKVMDACDEKTDETLSVHYGESVLLNCSLPPEHKERHLKSVHWKKKTPNTQSINLLYYEESMRKLDTPSGITLVGNPSAGDGSLVFNMSEVDRAGVYWCELKAKVGMESRFSKKICVTVREASLPVSTTVATVLAAWGYHRNQQRIMERFINRASVQTTGPYENFQPSKNFQEACIYDNET